MFSHRYTYARKEDVDQEQLPRRTRIRPTRNHAAGPKHTLGNKGNNTAQGSFAAVFDDVAAEVTP